MPYHILVVDDDSVFREELRDVLCDYTVSEAAHGEQAMVMLSQPNDIDLVILDINMPGSRGTEVLKQIRKMNFDVHIIMLTGHGTKDTVLDSWQGRADAFIEKPVAPDTIKNHIVRLLEKRERSDIARDGHENLDGLAAKIERVKRLAERNYHRKITLTDAARTVFLCPKYLSRVFKEYTGTGFSEYKLLMKVEHAKKLLRTTNQTVEEISERLGYASTESFIRIFKSLARQTPTEYRKQIPDGPGHSRRRIGTGGS